MKIKKSDDGKLQQVSLLRMGKNPPNETDGGIEELREAGWSFGGQLKGVTNKVVVTSFIKCCCKAQV